MESFFREVLRTAESRGLVGLHSSGWKLRKLEDRLSPYFSRASAGWTCRERQENQVSLRGVLPGDKGPGQGVGMLREASVTGQKTNMPGQPRPGSPQVVASGVRLAVQPRHRGCTAVAPVSSRCLQTPSVQDASRGPRQVGQYTAVAAQVEGRGRGRAFSGPALPFPLGGLGFPEASAAPVRLTAQ